MDVKEWMSKAMGTTIIFSSLKTPYICYFCKKAVKDNYSIIPEICELAKAQDLLLFLNFGHELLYVYALNSSDKLLYEQQIFGS